MPTELFCNCLAGCLLMTAGGVPGQHVAAGGNHSTTPPTSVAAAITSAAPSPPPFLQLAVAGAQLATKLAQGPTSPLLRRGAGMLVLFSTSWNGKAQLLQAGKSVIALKPFTHCSVLQLMSNDGPCCGQVLSSLCQCAWLLITWRHQHRSLATVPSLPSLSASPLE
jgi:hypothetical protein